ncbi:MAG: hypothetical protein IPO78_16645 [Saprospiraceae bacterium]|nr:hypothetical protein [Saprospiraceae bacterium]
MKLNILNLHFLLILLLIYFITSCTKNETEILDPASFGYDYYPLAIGKSWTYQTDSIFYSLKGTVEMDSTTSFIREEIVDTMRNSVNALVYRVDVFHAVDSSLGWELISSSFIEKNQYQLNKVENGLTFIRLVFPVQLNKSWNGNSMISSKTSIEVNGEILEPFDNWYYSYKYLNKSETLAGKIYASVCKVVEVDEENIIAKRYSETKYAKEVGMIFRELWLLDTQNTNTNIPFRNRAEKGFILRQTLVNHN